jgi:transposase
MENIGSGEAARRLGMTVKTLQRWGREGRLIPLARTASDRRRYSKSNCWTRTAMLLAHRIGIESTPAQCDYFARAAGTARRVWNWALAQWNRQAAAGGRPHAMLLKKQFNAIKYAHPDWQDADGQPWLRTVHRDAHAQPFAHLAAAWARFFAARRAGLPAHPPRFKKKGRCRCYKARRYGTAIVLADRWFPSSRLCSACGVRNGTLALSERAWTCGCGVRHDRDVNAAHNLKRLATGALAARSALPVASQAATPGTAAEDVSAAGGKVTPARHEHGQVDGSGQEENAAHFCARS